MAPSPNPTASLHPQCPQSHQQLGSVLPAPSTSGFSPHPAAIAGPFPPDHSSMGRKGPKNTHSGVGDGCSGLVPKRLAQALGGMPAAHRQGTASLPRGRGRGRFHRSPGSWGCGTWQALGGKGTGLRPRANCTRGCFPLCFFFPPTRPPGSARYRPQTRPWFPVKPLT